jgi:hypothetical protein
MPIIKKIGLAIGTLIVLGIAGNIIRSAAFNATHDNHDIAQMIVEQIKSTEVKLDDSFTNFEVVKDPGGAGVIVRYTVKNQLLANLKNIEQKELREFAVSSFGYYNLKRLIEKKVYFIFSFTDENGTQIKSVVISPTNFQ